MDLCEAIDYVSKNRNADIGALDIEEGHLFLRTLVKDLGAIAKLMKAHLVSTDKRGYLKENLFPVSVDVINREEAPGKEVHVGYGLSRVCATYFGLCPELENFVTVVLWPDESQASREAYEKIYTTVTEDKERAKVIRFRGKYGHELPNLIHPFVGRTIEALKRTKHMYDWRHAPYLKEVGTTIRSHKSPLNFRKVFSQDESRHPVYINLKSTIGKVLELRRDQVEILLPSFPDRSRSYVARIGSRVFSTLNGSTKDVTHFFLIQESAQENVTPVIVETSLASPADFLGSFTTFLLYTVYLGSGRLRLMDSRSSDRLARLLVDYCVYWLDKYCCPQEKNFDLSIPGNMFKAYLFPLFKKINDHIYYVPPSLSDTTSEILNVFDQHLASSRTTPRIPTGLLFDEGGHLKDMTRVAKSFEYLAFLQELKKFIWWGDDHQQIFESVRDILSLDISQSSPIQ